MSLDKRQGASPPVTGVGDLVDWFRARERPSAQWKVGIEYETLAQVRGTTDPAPYGGRAGIEALLRAFSRFGYTPFEEDGHAIAAEKGGLTISIEPGGQVELSGRPFRDVHEVAAEIDRHLEMGRAIGEDLGVDLLAAGYRPFGTPATARWVPKARYAVMRPFLAARGRLAEDMMSMTASAQASFDFGSERDAGEKLRVALAAQPALAALVANSPVVAGRDVGWKSYRTEVWTHTDPARCGMLPFAFEPGFEEATYERYAAWALDVPMVFLRRDGRYLDTRGATFRSFLEEGLSGHRPTLQDWEDHLSALFPDVRLKGVVEVRGADSVAPALVKALAAFWKGLLYNRESRDWAWDLVKRLGLEERLALREAAGRLGLAARLPGGKPLAELAGELVEAASLGLCRQGACGERGEDERVWLSPLKELAAARRSPADAALEAFRSGGAPALSAVLRVA
ncbi:MAG TPA: glutamate-cysteine ligase family protein [Anaeromyxobacteraceae bacterium]|nr:glutamate-cysteine ligase family protein [Anaeromyxobacteraceae bacterium]